MDDHIGMNAMKYIYMKPAGNKLDVQLIVIWWRSGV